MTYRQALLEALAQSGRSGRDVSIEAVGHESAIRSLKRGLDMRVSTIQALCQVLELEFYVGPPREVGPQPAHSDDEGALAAVGVVEEAGLSRADRLLLRTIEDVLVTLDDPEFRVTLASLTRFACKRSATAQAAGGQPA